MNGCMVRPTAKVVAEIGHPSTSFWAKRKQVPEGHIGLDIHPKHTRSMANTETIPPLRLINAPKQLGEDATLPFEMGTVREIYLHMITTNPFIHSWIVPFLVSEAHRVLEDSGNLVFFNGYLRSPCSVLVDFESRQAVLSPQPTNRSLYNYEVMISYLNSLFTPLSLEEHNLFLAEKRLGRATELEPGVNVSVLIRKP